MFKSRKQLVGTSARARGRRAARLGLEALEARLVLSGTSITDMTGWAQRFPAPTHSQRLLLNFDGKNNEGSNISKFVAPSGQNTEATIQDIIFRVSEIFSPFNVEVQRVTSDGVDSKTQGDTTVFIGGNVSSDLSFSGATYVPGIYYTVSFSSVGGLRGTGKPDSGPAHDTLDGTLASLFYHGSVHA